ncbi:hypothetical protein OLMES_0396 [Oleiphilus messinensis]|uniref:Peptidoglycan binding-like domain-containing protein n=1 Tax=Oleiphilus messinensis TaxID=141451 RepID=A0A1Y0I2L7_9GAMM|nr:peptidoglycan-binding protein [Oleiphilus messinensis]ARU54500.1 hypothetical protein OLMES_0396 [Oleiphilus messinensis]
MALKFVYFKSNSRIINAHKNSPPMRKGEKGSAVAVLQAALIDAGYPMPKSMKSKVPDGVYGSETQFCVSKFQQDLKLSLVDGIAGKETISHLDDRLFALTKKVIGSGSSVSLISFPSTPEYQIGAIAPTVMHDIGAGVWKSSPVTTSAYINKHLILEILPASAAIIGDDAAKHMAHYFSNTGKDLTIDLEDMLADVQSAQIRFIEEVQQAQKFVEMLPVGHYNIRSKRVNSAYNQKRHSINWFFAIGGYSTWGEGKATVSKSGASTLYSLDFEYKFVDRYNWDGGKSVELFGIKITDDFMGEFHRQGLAREFNMYGSVKRNFLWEKGRPIPIDQFQVTGGSVKKYGW